MNPFEFVIAILILVFLGNALKSYCGSKRGETRKKDAEDDANLERLAQLEERIRVLERIVTDEQLDLKQRFKNL